MATVFEPIRPVPPMTTIFIPYLLVRNGRGDRFRSADAILQGHYRIRG
jgi:hypothetical protein